MPSPDIVRAVRSQIQNKLLPATNHYWRSQVQFGLAAYGLRPFHSASSNARQVVPRSGTAARKQERLFANADLALQLGTVCDSLHLVRPSSYVNVDHSDMHGLTALVGAVQTRNGRAIPCLVETTYALHIPAYEDASPRWRRLRQDMVRARRQQSFTGHTIDALQDFHDRLGFWPKLVFDRGFGNETLVTHLHAEGAVFYVRLKRGRFVEFDGHKTEVQALADKDARVQVLGLPLRVIRSPKSRRAKEPWYILTNDQTSSRTKIVRVYYHRFEIEETFRDMKHIWGLKRTRLNRPLSLKLLLWFVSLGIAVLYCVTRPRQQVVHRGHPKKQTSWLRQSYEKLQQGYALLLWGEG